MKKKSKNKDHKKEYKKIENNEINKEEKILDKKDKYLLYSVIAIFLIILAIFSFQYIYKYFNKEKQELPEIRVYNGYSFVKIGNYWQTKIKTKSNIGEREYEIIFHFTPDEVEDIPTEKNIRNESITPFLFMNTEKIYITTNPDYPSSVVIGGVEISKIIGQVFRKKVMGALTKEVSNSNETPIITCDDINDNQRVIYLKLGNETKIYSDNGCIIVLGENPEMLLKASERLAFEILKIL